MTSEESVELFTNLAMSKAGKWNECTCTEAMVDRWKDALRVFTDLEESSADTPSLALIDVGHKRWKALPTHPPLALLPQPAELELLPIPGDLPLLPMPGVIPLLFPGLAQRTPSNPFIPGFVQDLKSKVIPKVPYREEQVDGDGSDQDVDADALRHPRANHRFPWI